MIEFQSPNLNTNVQYRHHTILFNDNILNDKMIYKYNFVIYSNPNLYDLSNLTVIYVGLITNEWKYSLSNNKKWLGWLNKESICWLTNSNGASCFMYDSIYIDYEINACHLFKSNNKTDKNDGNDNYFSFEIDLINKQLKIIFDRYRAIHAIPKHILDQSPFRVALSLLVKGKYDIGIGLIKIN